MNFCEITCTSENLILFFYLLSLKSANKTKTIHENSECHTLEREEASSKASLCFIVMDDYSDECSSDQ